ncbi:MAG: serine/threonine-protein kinase [Planctomycetota bacterium]|nr:serine/threonine-protein kinase [Planctomycetota bacterium]
MRGQNPTEGWPPGSVLAGKYEIGQILGVGGMGAVFQARDLQNNEQLAVKLAIINNQREDVVTRFQRESKLSQLINHPNIIQIFESGHGENGTHFLTMEMLDGCDLKEKLEETGPLSPELAVEYTIQILEALVACHSKCVIHRDVKPENIRLIERDNKDCLVLMDFGLARFLSAEDHHTPSSPMQYHTQADKSTGSPMYMSPESFTKPDDLDPRCDLYSLGITLFELLTGQPPFLGRTLIQLMGKHVYTVPPKASEMAPNEIPSNLDIFVSRLLEKDRDKRFASSEQALDFLRKIQEIEGWLE